jgi:NAD(P)-dependent dehydrogenase (short-subunit alcohol dehydrogenase family)
VHYNKSEGLALQLKNEMAHRFPHIDVGLYKAELSSEEEIKVLFDQVVHGKNQPIEPSQFQGQSRGQNQHPDKPSKLACIVNNASLFEPDTGMDFTSARALEQLKVNLLAPMLLGQALAQFYLNRPHDKNLPLSPTPNFFPSIVHVLDQKVFNLNPDYFSYTLSKLALERAVSLQAQSLAPTIRVNAVAPGLMYLSGDQTQENFDKASKINVLQKAIDPQDVAKSCFFLASTESLCGTTIRVDCGQHLLPLARDVMFMVDEALALQTRS